MQALTEAVKIDPTFGQAYYQLGVATWWLYSDSGAGRDHIQHLLDNELYATTKEKEMAEAMLLVVDNRWSDAKPMFEKLVNHYPDEKYAWYALGESQYHSPSGNLMDEARGSFEQAVALDPEFLLPYRHIFDTLWAVERYEEAIKRADDLLELEPNNPLWHRYKVGSMAITGDISRMETALAKALETNGTPEDRRELYKTVAFQVARLDYAPLAEKYTRKALDADPAHDDPQLVRSLLNSLRQQFKHDEYETWVRDILADEPDNDAYRASLLDVKFFKHEFATVFEWRNSCVPTNRINHAGIDTSPAPRSRRVEKRNSKTSSREQRNTTTESTKRGVCTRALREATATSEIIIKPRRTS